MEKRLEQQEEDGWDTTQLVDNPPLPSEAPITMIMVLLHIWDPLLLLDVYGYLCHGHQPTILVFSSLPLGQ
jgi:hypothetical protein